MAHKQGGAVLGQSKVTHQSEHCFVFRQGDVGFFVALQQVEAHVGGLLGFFTYHEHVRGLRLKAGFLPCGGGGGVGLENKFVRLSAGRKHKAHEGQGGANLGTKGCHGMLLCYKNL